MRVHQHESWEAPPERLPNGFQASMPSGTRTMTASCEVWTNPSGWELRLIVDGGTLMSTVVPSVSEMLALVETWRAAMLRRGWQ